MKNLLKTQFGYTELYEIQEGGTVNYLDIENCNFSYTGLEHFYSDLDYNIIIYFSHENSITFGGAKLISEIQKIWPEHQQNAWNNPFG